MSRTFSRASVATLALLVAATACSDGNGPATTSTLPIEASTIEERSALVSQVTEQPILQQLFTDAPSAAARMPAGLRVTRSIASTLLRTPDASTPEALRGMLRGAVTRDPQAPRADFAPGQPVVPAAMRGYAFVYSFADGWIVDRLADGTPRPGAPTNGARFVVQPLDAYGYPTGERLGYLEVVDNSSSTVTRYVMRVVTSAGLVVLQSTTSLAGDEFDPTIAQSGWVTDGTRRIDESASLTSSRVTYTYDAPFAGLHYGITASGDPMSGTMRFVFTITVDGTSVRVTMSATQTSATIVVTVNGAIWARQTSTVDAYGEMVEGEWMQADGRTPLSAEQLARFDALGAMMDQFGTLELVDAIASGWVAQAGY